MEASAFLITSSVSGSVAWGFAITDSVDIDVDAPECVEGGPTAGRHDRRGVVLVDEQRAVERDALECRPVDHGDVEESDRRAEVGGTGRLFTGRRRDLA